MLLTPICATLASITDALINELERPGVSKKDLIAACSVEAVRLSEATDQLTEINLELISLEKSLKNFSV